MLYPQNGDRIVAIDFVTSLYPTYSVVFLCVCMFVTLVRPAKAAEQTETPSEI